jgi:hypothetical protein
LVTGSRGRLADVAPALEEAGLAATPVDQDEDLAKLCAALGPSSVDGYLQLPVEIRPRGDTSLDRVRELLEQGLLSRFEAMRVVLPTLTQEAAVVLVSGNLLTTEPIPDDQRARIALLRVLAHCVIADAGEVRPWVTVVDHRRSSADIAAIVRDRGEHRLRMVADFAKQNPDMSYDDWKLAILTLSTGEI